jgi:hypothetical protein
MLTLEDNGTTSSGDVYYICTKRFVISQLRGASCWQNGWSSETNDAHPASSLLEVRNDHPSIELKETLLLSADTCAETLRARLEIVASALPYAGAGLRWSLHSIRMSVAYIPAA